MHQVMDLKGIHVINEITYVSINHLIFFETCIGGNE
jgi:hypothetical protein